MFACDASRQTRLFSIPIPVAWWGHLEPNKTPPTTPPQDHLLGCQPRLIPSEVVAFSLSLCGDCLVDHKSLIITPALLLGDVLRTPRNIPLQHHQLLGLAAEQFGETRSSRCRRVAWKSCDSPHPRPPSTLHFTMTTSPTPQYHLRRESESDHSEPMASGPLKAERQMHNPQKGKS